MHVLQHLDPNHNDAPACNEVLQHPGELVSALVLKSEGTASFQLGVHLTSTRPISQSSASAGRSAAAARSPDSHVPFVQRAARTPRGGGPLAGTRHEAAPRAAAALPPFPPRSPERQQPLHRQRRRYPDQSRRQHLPHGRSRLRAARRLPPRPGPRRTGAGSAQLPRGRRGQLRGQPSVGSTCQYGSAELEVSLTSRDVFSNVQVGHQELQTKCGCAGSDPGLFSGNACTQRVKEE